MFFACQDSRVFAQVDTTDDGQVVQYEDLLNALEDPSRRETVFSDLYPRATELLENQREAFLRKALASESSVVRSQAAEALSQMGLLQLVLRDRLEELKNHPNPDTRRAAVFATQVIDQPAPLSTDAAVLAADLVSPDFERVAHAQMELRKLGVGAVPALLEALDGSDVDGRRNAAILLAEIALATSEPVTMLRTAPAPAPPDASGGEPDFKIAPPLASSRSAAPGPTAERQTDGDSETVRVYFGTNREKVDAPRRPWKTLIGSGAVAVLVFPAMIFVFWPSKSSRRGGCLTSVLTIVLLAALVGAVWIGNEALQEVWAYNQGIQFRPYRSPGSEIYYGHCDVSIPASHTLGKLERPVWGAEDEAKHIVLQNTEILEQNQFFEAVKAVMANPEYSSRDCFIFVHGFNVTFEEAAQRTAQIHHDLEFAGAPLFYSWPSAGSELFYSHDRAEIANSRFHLQKFLMSVKEQVNPDKVHVIAHSMGTDILSQAIASIDAEGKLFDQIVLAAPDIDIDVFKNQLLPALASKATRTTLYCSRNDTSLALSYKFNNAPRLGDSSRVVFVDKMLDTVDVSDIDCDMMGHLYYGDAVQVLKDVAGMFEQNLGPPNRGLESQSTADQLAYWLLRLKR